MSMRRICTLIGVCMALVCDLIYALANLLCACLPMAVIPHRGFREEDLHHEKILGLLWPLSYGVVVACLLVTDHGGSLLGK